MLSFDLNSYLFNEGPRNYLKFIIILEDKEAGLGPVRLIALSRQVVSEPNASPPRRSPIQNWDSPALEAYRVPQTFLMEKETNKQTKKGMRGEKWDGVNSLLLLEFSEWLLRRRAKSKLEGKEVVQITQWHP